MRRTLWTCTRSIGKHPLGAGAEGITRKSFSGNGATLALHRLMPKHEPNPHKHTYEQLVYILAGHIASMWATRAWCLVLVACCNPADVMHSGEVVGDDPCSIWISSPRCERNMRLHHDSHVQP